MSTGHLRREIYKEIQAASLSRRLHIWSRDKLLVTLFLCQLLVFGVVLTFSWKVSGNRLMLANGVKHSSLPLHDDPVGLVRQSRQELDLQHGTEQAGPPDLSTLVLYIFSPTDPEYLNNLLYFIREGIQADDGCNYVIVVNQAMGEEMASFGAMAHLAQLPANARYVTHRNECYDWGTLGWLINERKVDVSQYKYLIFINSSVRGPFLPAYWPKSVHWSRIFTGRITNTTKLVGPTISCEGIQPAGMPERKNPHVQSFVVATDQVGLGLWLADGNVFKCYDHIHLTMFHSELGASKAILDAGYNIDSLMLRYQGVNWHDKSHWNCNANESPYKESHYDGINIDPLEVLFVKVKDPLLELRYSASLKAARYDAWFANAAAAALPAHPQKRDVSSNQYLSLPADFRTVVLTADGRSASGKCFDVPYYKHYSPELTALEDRIALQHFAAKGQFEGRYFRFVQCPS